MPMLTDGTGLGEIAGAIPNGTATAGAGKSGSSKSSGIEDSSLAIDLSIRASWRGHSVPISLFSEYQAKFVPWSLRRLRPSPDAALEASHVLGVAILSRDGRRDFNPFAAAFFAESLFRRLAIKTAQSRIMEANDARKLTPTCIVKFEQDSKLRWSGTAQVAEPVSSRYALVCDVIPDAATVDFLRRAKLGIPDASDNEPFEAWSALRATGKIADAQLQRVVQLISKTCRFADTLFAGMDVTREQLQAAQWVAEFVSEAWFRIAAARIFIGCTSPHFSNVLVSKDGSLISIDHDSARFETGEDLKMLFRFVRRGSRVFDLLREVAALVEEDIRSAVDSIPKHPACGSTDGLADYFCERLALWKALYAGKSAPSRAISRAV